VVPTQMTMDMHMVGGMYGVTDKLTVMAMTNYTQMHMDHVTYQGGMRTTQRGTFSTQSKGLGDTTIGAIYGLDDGLKRGHQLNVNLGISIPTGSNKETDQILTPMGGTPSPRLPYPMQLGTGTFDLKPGMTYSDRQEKFGWGTQFSGRIPLGKNTETYKRGDKIEGTAWLAYEAQYGLSFSARLKAQSQGKIEGQDTAIIAPVQTADPNNHGGDQAHILFGINLLGQSDSLKGHRIAAEVSLPIYRNLNGPQLETDHTVTLGWQKAF